MKKALFLFLGMALCGCATTRVPQLEQPGYMKVLAAKKVAPVTYARIAHGRVLGYDDIRNLAVKGIPGKMIVPYLKATKTPYDFSSRQINGLVDAGADSTLVMIGLSWSQASKSTVTVSLSGKVWQVSTKPASTSLSSSA